MPVSPEWEETINEIVADPGVVMVVGSTDVGKTHFCVQLANEAVRAGVAAAIVDADVGQSEIGAPGTIGMGLVESEVEVMSDIPPKRLYFVGATSPVGHMMESAIGAKKMVDAALDLGTELVVLDTTGMIDGYPGRKLKTYKTDLVRPKYLVGIQKKREVEHLLMPFAKISSIKVRPLKSSELARRKPPEFRAARRRSNYYKHFNESLGHMIHLDQVSLWNTWFRTGRPLKWQYMKFVEDALKSRVLHAEIGNKGLFIVSERMCRPQGRAELEEHFKTRNIRVVTAGVFQNLLVGLADDNGNTLNVGLIQAIDFKQKLMFVLSPMRTVSPVRVVQFGAMRVTKEGKELGTIKQGEL